MAPDIVSSADVFDEESCRFFLRECGEQIVPFYPFEAGIDEVYNLLLEQYTVEEMSDVLSVLHELLEDDDNASGLGDDGDIWRSWRHAWRRRNVRNCLPLNPNGHCYSLNNRSGQSRYSQSSQSRPTFATSTHLTASARSESSEFPRPSSQGEFQASRAGGN